MTRRAQLTTAIAPRPIEPLCNQADSDDRHSVPRCMRMICPRRSVESLTKVRGDTVSPRDSIQQISPTVREALAGDSRYNPLAGSQVVSFKLIPKGLHVRRFANQPGQRRTNESPLATELELGSTLAASLPRSVGQLASPSARKLSPRASAGIHAGRRLEFEVMTSNALSSSWSRGREKKTGKLPELVRSLAENLRKTKWPLRRSLRASIAWPMRKLRQRSYEVGFMIWNQGVSAA